jgi:hypothetical protein
MNANWVAVIGIIGTVTAAAMTAIVSLKSARQAASVSRETASQAAAVSRETASQAASVSLETARAARELAERSWIRDSRRQIYGDYIAKGQALLLACIAAHDVGDKESSSDTDEHERTNRVYCDFLQTYAVLQTLAETETVAGARDYGYRLIDLANMALSRESSESFEGVSTLVRGARHAAIDAMRKELGLQTSASPTTDYNPYIGTEFEDAYNPEDERWWARVR